MSAEGRALQRKLNRLDEPREVPHWVYLVEPYTSASWDGDARSTTAKTLIDLSATFSDGAGNFVPSNVKAVLVRTEVRDSGSAGGDCYLFLSPNDTAGSGLMASPAGLVNDFRARGTHTVPCNADGDVYFQILATGALTFDVKIEVWGWEC